jgi:7-cyano-7-deazaguanine synthase
MSRGVVIISGGMDSVSLAHMLHKQGNELYLLSFNYGQRHSKEIAYAKACAEDLGCLWQEVDLTNVGSLLKGSALTDDVSVPDGHYTWDTMKITVVPNRNAIMLAIATGVAVSWGANFVATGVHAGDHRIYPDCRPEFIYSMSDAMVLGTEEFSVPGFKIIAPFVYSTKAQIASIGEESGVDFAKTWSCYKGGEIHCGTCGTCYERREALSLAGIVDPTEYINNTEVYEEQA